MMLSAMIAMIAMIVMLQFLPLILIVMNVNMQTKIKKAKAQIVEHIVSIIFTIMNINP